MTNILSAKELMAKIAKVEGEKASKAMKAHEAEEAVIAWPVTYGETGVSTFMVSQSGYVYEKDLGPETSTEATAITLFNPDKTWDKADMTPPPPSP
jgi:hypothetical protein